MSQPNEQNVPLGARPHVTRRVTQGAAAHLYSHNYHWCPEFRVKTGRRIDLLGVSPKGQLWAIEIKSSVEDYRSDSKWPEYLAYCDQFSFAVGPDFPLDVLPQDVGIIITDGYEHHQRRKPMQTAKLSGGARKSLLIRFSRTTAYRAHLAQQQLIALGQDLDGPWQDSDADA